MPHHHHETKKVLEVIRAVPNVEDRWKEFLIAKMHEEASLNFLKDKTIHAFALGFALGTMRRFPDMDHTALERIIDACRDLSTLPFADPSLS